MASQRRGAASGQFYEGFRFAGRELSTAGAAVVGGMGTDDLGKFEPPSGSSGRSNGLTTPRKRSSVTCV